MTKSYFYLVVKNSCGKNLVRGVCRKFATRPKNLPLTKNLHFCFNQANIQLISPTHEVIILTKFHDVRVKTVDFSLIAKFWLRSKLLAYLSTL